MLFNPLLAMLNIKIRSDERTREVEVGAYRVVVKGRRQLGLAIHRRIKESTREPALLSFYVCDSLMEAQHHATYSVKLLHFDPVFDEPPAFGRRHRLGSLQIHVMNAQDRDAAERDQQARMDRMLQREEPLQN